MDERTSETTRQNAAGRDRAASDPTSSNRAPTNPAPINPAPINPAPSGAPVSDIARRKNDLRSSLAAVRRARPAPGRAAAAAANGGHLIGLLAGAGIVCCYLPLATEPMAAALLDTLVATGTTVLVPMVRADAPLDWCRYPGPTQRGAFGIAEPTGRRLGAGIVRRADSILVPAFAVDPAGRRLGRGGGHYDRTLALLDARSQPAPRPGKVAPELIAVLFDGEVLAEVPADSHDMAVTAAVTPSDGIRYFRS